MSDQSILGYVVPFLNNLYRIYLFLDNLYRILKIYIIIFLYNPEGLDTKVGIFRPVLPIHFHLVVHTHIWDNIWPIKYHSEFPNPFITVQYWRKTLLKSWISQFQNICTCVVSPELKGSTSNEPTSWSVFQYILGFNFQSERSFQCWQGNSVFLLDVELGYVYLSQ